MNIIEQDYKDGYNKALKDVMCIIKPLFNLAISKEGVSPAKLADVLTLLKSYTKE